MTLYVVTVKVPGTVGHDPQRKQTGSCPTSDACTDRTGRHHSTVCMQNQLDLLRAAGTHITRVEPVGAEQAAVIARALAEPVPR